MTKKPIKISKLSELYIFILNEKTKERILTYTPFKKMEL